MKKVITRSLLKRDFDNNKLKSKKKSKSEKKLAYEWNEIQREKKKHRMQKKLDAWIDGWMKLRKVTLHWLHENNRLFIDISIKKLIKKRHMHFCFNSIISLCAMCMVCAQYRHQIFSLTHTSIGQNTEYIPTENDME